MDDEPDVERLVRQRMRREIRSDRYEFVFAGNGIEALAKLREHQDIDMVLSDINMPEMDGLTLLQQIRRSDPNVRSVVVSAYGDMKNIRTAMNRGAFDFVTKPIDFDDLRITIARTLETIELWRTALESRDKLVVLENELSLATGCSNRSCRRVFPKPRIIRSSPAWRRPATSAGDFYDLMPMENGHIGLAVADVSGKGIPAAMFMMSSRTLLRGAAIGRSEPSAILREVNQLLCENNDTAMFVTLFIGIFDPATGNLVYANGGHNPPVIFRADGTHGLLPTTDGIALGIFPDISFKENSITLAPGDSAILYSDGVTEGGKRSRRTVRTRPVVQCLCRSAAARCPGGHGRGPQGRKRVRRRRAPVRRHHLPYVVARRRDR